MKVIIFKRPDGGCSVVRPAPEIFDPNSRTIRGMEVSGVIYPSIRKLMDIEFHRSQEFVDQIGRIHAELPALKLLATNQEVEPEHREGAARKLEALNIELLGLEGELEWSRNALSGDRTKHPDFNMDAFREEAWIYIAAKAVPEGAEYRFAEDSDLPDREYRNAWKEESGAVVIDMPKAREIHREHMRQCRRPLLEALDVQYHRADEADAIGDGQAKAKIAAQKQALRDVTKLQAIEEAQTPEDLKKAWPAILGVRNVL